MSASVETNRRAMKVPGAGLSLWTRQVEAIFQLEVRKNFLGKRSILIYLLAGFPVCILTLLTLVTIPTRRFPNLATIYAWIYAGLILRTVVFFGCAWIFMNLFRGELVDRSLHYYFLAPVRREVLIVGKYLSGLICAALLFGGTTILSMLILYFPHFAGESTRYFLDGPGLGQILTCLAVTTLACVGYGAFFLVIGLFVRNPIIPAVLLYGWEFINFLLPPLLKKISVIHYLNSLVPVPVSEGPFAVVAEPTPAWLATIGLLAVTALVLAGAGYRVRHTEIRYGGD
jgi:ABC-type transport system involved in multi-copper enzyme maturation permease subunit